MYIDSGGTQDSSLSLPNESSSRTLRIVPPSFKTDTFWPDFGDKVGMESARKNNDRKPFRHTRHHGLCKEGGATERVLFFVPSVKLFKSPAS